MGGIAAGLLAFFGRKPSALAAALTASAIYAWPGKPFNFRDKAVVITGGSRGLGFALARNLVRTGAKVALIARDAQELESAKSQLGKDHTRLIAIPCDVTEASELENAVNEVVKAFGGIDVWINDAGSILVGPLRAMTQADFEALLRTQVHAIWSATQLLIPIFKQAGGGKIVNISSIGGKLAVPHLGAYTTAKFALAGLSSTMNAELAADNIQVTTVFPGLMRVGSAIQAVVKGDHDKEFAWFALGSVTPVLSVSADSAARRILGAVARGDAQLVFPVTMRVATIIQTALPELTAWATRFAAGMFPKSDTIIGKTGAHSEGWLRALPLARPVIVQLEKQQSENNETRKTDARFNLGIES